MDSSLVARNPYRNTSKESLGESLEKSSQKNFPSYQIF